MSHGTGWSAASIRTIKPRVLASWLLVLTTLSAYMPIASCQESATPVIPKAVQVLAPELVDPVSVNDPVANLERLQQLADLPSAPQGVVVMTDGRTFTGTLNELPGGYRVEFSGTYITVPFEYVLVTARTLPEAYEKLRTSVPRHTAESHLKLAEWCRAQGLLGEALKEVEAALQTEPLRTDARQLLKELEQQIQLGEVPVGAVPPVGVNSPAGPANTGSTSLGLSREGMQEYIRHIQPLLLNKCGNGACHGATSPQSFKLASVGGQLHQKNKSEQNLAAVLELISPADPVNSPLLAKPRELTTAHRHLFAGSSGKRQQALIDNWVQTVLREQGLVPQVVASTSPPPANPLIVTTAINADPQTIPQTGPIQAAKATVRSTAMDQTPADSSPLLAEVLAQERPDAFDPDVFNRRVHGRSAMEMRSLATSVEQPAEPEFPVSAPHRFSTLGPVPSLESPTQLAP